MHTTFRLAISGVLLMLGSTAYAGNANCHKGDLMGRYFVQTSGSLIPRLQTGPDKYAIYEYEIKSVTVAGTLTFDGQGNVVMETTWSLADYPTDNVQVAGTYTLDNTCRGSMDFMVEGPEPDHYYFAISKSGTLQVVRMDIGILLSGTAYQPEQ